MENHNLRITSHVDQFVLEQLAPKNLWPEMNYEVLPELKHYPVHMNAATELIGKGIKDGYGDKIAVQYKKQIWTYSELEIISNKIAGVLKNELDFVPGNRVLVRSANHPMLIASWLAILKAGGVAVATMPVLKRRELEYIIEKAQIEYAICHEVLIEELDELKFEDNTLERIIQFGDGDNELEKFMFSQPDSFENVETCSTDPAIIGFTSGSTGDPKGVVHFHRDLLAAADTFAKYIVKIKPGDIVCGSPQIAFLYGLCAFIVDTLRFGASSVLLDRATPESLLETIESSAANVCFSTPSAYNMMLEHVHKYDLSSLRVCVAGGEPLLPATFHEWEKLTGIRIINGLGISELLHIFISSVPEESKPGTIGKGIPGFDVRVVNEKFEDTIPDEVGQMIVKGPIGCRYLGDEIRQEKYVKNGWNQSGDLCKKDEEGYISFEARTDDMILTSGYNVSGLEVEAVLMENDLVKECAVVGSPDYKRGEIVKAFIVLKDFRVGNEETVSILQDFVKENISSFKYPREIEFVESLPLTATGKIQRGVLREEEKLKKKD